MSNKGADELWRNVMMRMLQQIELEKQNAAVANDSNPLLYRYFTTYLGAYRDLEKCYAMHTHPQKRLVVKQALDAVVGRLLETRQLIMQNNHDAFPDMFNLLSNGQQLPGEFDIPLPRYATQDNLNILNRNFLTKTIIEKYNASKFNGSLFDQTHTLENYKPGCGYTDAAAQTKDVQAMTLQDAILLIQRAERGRNARVRANLFKNLQRSKQEGILMSRDVIVNREAAAIVIQKNWRAVLGARQVNLIRQSQQVFLGAANYSTLGNSVLPIVQAIISKDIVKRQADIERQHEIHVQDKIQQLNDMLFSPNRHAKDIAVLPHQIQLSLAPLGTSVDPQTCDPFESQYSLSRQIDKTNLLNNREQMLQNKPNILDSAFCCCPEPIRKLVLRQTAEYLLSVEYQNVLSEHQKTALARTNQQILQADQDLIGQKVEEEEAEELRQNLRRRHWEAIEAKIQRAQTGADDAGANKAPVLKTTVEYPQVPLEIRTADEVDLMAEVAAERQRKIDALKKKKTKKAKPAAAAVEEELDEQVKQMSSFMTPIVDSTIEYFIRWQREEEDDSGSQIYNVEYVKELYRPKIYEKVFQEVYDEVQEELEQIAKNAALINAMGGKKKAKMPKKVKKPKVKKGQVYVEPDPVGPIGPPEAEAAYAEMVSEGVVKIIKPATFDDIVVSEKFMAPGDKESKFLQDQARKYLGKKDEPGAEPAAPLAPPLPSYNCIKNSIISSVILPLATPTIRAPQLLIDRPTRLLIFGAPGSGKSLLTRAIATHLGALFIDLSPANLYNKFPASEMQFLFSKLKQFVFANTPAVVYVDEAELIVPAGKAKGKKTKGKGGGDDGQTPGQSMSAEGYPKTMDKQMAPDRIRKELLKFLKLCTKESGVILIGNATRTFGREKALSGLFDSLVYLPLPDYTMRLKLITHFFSRMGLKDYGLGGVAKDVRCLVYKNQKHTNNQDLVFTPLGLIGLQKGFHNSGVGSGKFFDLSTLARACDGLTAGQIEEVIMETLTPNRVASIAQRPLDIMEFLPALQAQTPQHDSTISHTMLFGMNVAPQPPPKLDDKKK